MPSTSRCYHRIIRRNAAVILLCAIASSCSGKKEEEQEALLKQDRPVEEIYNSGYSKFENGKYKDAMKDFEDVEQQYPYSEWAIRSKIMAAYSAYKIQEFDKAIPMLENFVKMHPANKNTSYAYYLLALCYYDQITDVGRDQSTTQNSLNALQDILQRYPDSDYARDAKLKLDLVNDHLAGKEMEVGRYYLTRKEHLAAINRFKKVVEEFETTSHVPEALHRLVECYGALGIGDEARRYASVLGHNYPDNKWYKRSYILLTTGNAEAEKNKSFLNKLGL